MARLAEAGARVRDIPPKPPPGWWRDCAASLGALVSESVPTRSPTPFAAINVGLESLLRQPASRRAPRRCSVDWRPPAGGNEKLLALLDKMKS